MQRAVGVGLPPSIWVWYLVRRSLDCSACVWASGRIGSVSRMRVSRPEVVSRRPFILILHSPERRDRVKSLFNSLDMDGTVGAWRTRMGLVDGERTLAGFRVDLGPAGSFDFGQYRRAMAVGTAWLAGRMPAMREFVVMHLRNIRDARRLEHPERTLASYVFQEAEGVSRAAKLQWSVVRGHAVQNLQHDGVVVRLGFGDGVVGAARELTRACSHALGYEQPVERK